MKRLITTVLVLCGVSVMADPPETHVVDFSGRTAPGLQVYQANQKTFRWTMRNGNEAVSLAGRTPFMYWATGNTATSVVSATCSVVTSTSGVFDAVFSAANLNTNGVMIYGVGISSGAVTVARQGAIIITRDPYATGAGSISYTTTFNWDLYTIAGTSPYMLKPTNTAVSAYVLTSDGTTTGSYWAASSGSGSDTNTAINIATNKAVVESTRLGDIVYVPKVSTNDLRIAATNEAVTESTRLGNLAYLTSYTETDPLWSAWRTNSAAGSTNCVLPDGSLVDVKALFGGVGTETDPVAATNNVKRSDTNGWTVSAHEAWLTAETDPLWSAWRTNSAAGSTNCVLPDGSLVDVKALFGGTGTGDLKADGSVPMTGDFNLDTHNVINSGDITASGALKYIYGFQGIYEYSGGNGIDLAVGGGNRRLIGEWDLFNGGLNLTGGAGISNGPAAFITSLTFDGGTVATNAGTAGAGYYAMSNGAWAAFAPGGASSDTNAAINIATNLVGGRIWYLTSTNAYITIAGTNYYLP